jgi:hypothetical protein
MSRAELIDRLMFKRISLPMYPHPLDPWRIALAQLAIAHRTKLEAQITCPLKSFNPRECFNCPDAQVIYCVTSNQHQRQELAARKRTNTETPFDMSDNAVLDSIPRNAAAIAAINTFKRRSIAQELGMFSTPEERTAFGALSPEAQAANILVALVARDGASGAPAAVTLLPPPTPAPVSAAVVAPPEPTPAPTPRPASIPPPASATPAPAPRPAEAKAASGGAGAARILELLEVIQASANEIASDDTIALNNIRLQLDENLRVSKENAEDIKKLRGEVHAQQQVTLTVGALLLAQAVEAFGWTPEEVKQRTHEMLTAFAELGRPSEGKAEPSGKAPAKEGKGRK